MIKGVAIKQGDLCLCLPEPNRHHNVIGHAIKWLGLTGVIGAAADSQGFYTDGGTFLNRKDAIEYARKHGQLINSDAKAYLFSEDLW